MKYITAWTHPGAGLGTQFCQWNLAYYLSGRLGLGFLHQPLTFYDEFLGLGFNELKFSDFSLPVAFIPPTEISETKGIKEIAEIAESVPDNTILHITQNECMHDNTLNQKDVARKYFEHRKRSPYRHVFTTSKKRIAVHIRRDVVPEDQVNRCLPLDYFVNSLKLVTGIYKDYELHIFSEGAGFARDRFSDFDASFHINEDLTHIGDSAFTAFHSMACSDILITSRSTFSYVAGIISDGVKISNWPWWFYIPDNRNGWIRSDKSGNFDTAVMIEGGARFSGMISN